MYLSLSGKWSLGGLNELLAYVLSSRSLCEFSCFGISSEGSCSFDYKAVEIIFVDLVVNSVHAAPIRFTQPANQNKLVGSGEIYSAVMGFDT